MAVVAKFAGAARPALSHLVSIYLCADDAGDGVHGPGHGDGRDVLHELQLVYPGRRQLELVHREEVAEHDVVAAFQEVAVLLRVDVERPVVRELEHSEAELLAVHAAVGAAVGVKVRAHHVLGLGIAYGLGGHAVVREGGEREEAVF